MIELFNIYYFIYIIIFLAILVCSLILLKDKSYRFKKNYIATLLFAGLLLHFLKLLFPPYKDDEMAFRKITPENICAFSTLIFPLVFYSKNKYLKDYMFYIGLLSGGLALVFPAEAYGKSPFIFDTIRFYICHIIVFIAPFLMVATGLHKLNYYRVFFVPISFLIVMVIILANEIILIEIGIVDITPEGKGLLDIDRYRNFSFIFGPTMEYFQSSNSTILEDIFNPFVPKVFRTIPFGPLVGEQKYWPIIWAIVPTFIFLPLLSFLMSIYWEKNHIKEDFNNMKLKLKTFFNN